MTIVDDINDISDAVLRLEQENENYQKLIDLVDEDIEWQERVLADKASDRMKEIIAAYRAVRPK